MALSSNFRPTLLVGLGGTGSKIAEDILRQASENDPTLTSNVGVLIVDTDLNDIKKLKYVPARSVVQISRAEKVYRMIERNARVEGDWLYSRKDPQMSEAILGMNIIDGAGQIRMVTRLALHDKFVNDSLLHRFESAISTLAVHGDDQNYDGAVHIMVIGSLAGATGSGSFAQVALALRQAAENRNVSASVRGLFLLPDIYARSGQLRRSQVPNILANGYASFKELNAFNIRAQLPQRKTNFSFEYLPGVDLKSGALPYEAITLIDQENSQGGSMGGGIDSYVRMAGRAGYLLIFSPLGARYGSVTINDVRQRMAAIENGTSNLYSGIGVAGIAYPVDSMRIYLSRRLVRENIKGDWTRLDDSFRAQVARYTQEQQAGQTGGAAPDIRVAYIRDLAQLAREEPRVPFFRRAYDYLFPEVEDEKTGERISRPRHVGFTDALVSYVDRQFWSEDDVNEVRQRNEFDTSTLLESDSITGTVRRAETDLDRDLRVLDRALQSRPEDIFYNSLITGDSLGRGEWAAHHIQSVIVEGEPHPVTARAFLYHLRAELETRRSAIDLRATRLKLNRLANTFRDDEEIQSSQNRPTSRSTSRVIDKATAADELSRLSDPFGKKRKAFAEDYVEYFNQTLTLMRRMAAETIAAKTLEQMISETNALINVFEGLFRTIETILDELETDISTEVEKYSASESYNGDTTVYANAACKEDAWQRMSHSASGLRLDDEINSDILANVYAKHREDKRGGNDTGFNKIRDLFREKVIIGFGEKKVANDFPQHFDMSVIQAMRRENAVLRGMNHNEEEGRVPGPVETDEDQLRRLIDRTANHAQPYLSFTDPDGGESEIKFWSIHPQVETDLNDNQLFGDLFRQDGDNPIVEPEFSKYQLICVNLRANVELSMLSKLQMGEKEQHSVHNRTLGRYAGAYDAMIKRMLEARPSGKTSAEFTPHVDRRWHMPGALPEIFSELDDEISEGSSKGFIAARMLDLISLEVEHGIKLARFNTRGYGLTRAVELDFSESHDDFVIATVFCADMSMVASATEYWDMTKERMSASLQTHPAFMKLASPERLLAILRPASVRNRDAEARDDLVTSCLAAWMELLGDLIATQETNLSPRGIKVLHKEQIESCRNALFDHVREEEYGPEIVKVFDSCFRGAYDQVFTA